MKEHTTPTLVWFVIDDQFNIKLTPTKVIAAPDHFSAVQHEPIIAEVLTPWVDTETMQLQDDHSPFVIEDAAQQVPIPEPNLGTAYIECGPDTLAAIDAFFR